MATALLALALAAPPVSDARVAGVPVGPPGLEFYDPPSPLPRGKHGAVIWARRVPAPQGARAFRVLYLSRLYDRKPAAVSGLVIAPRGRAPKGGRPVLAWAHGTVGGARECAPSAVPNPARTLLNYYGYRSPFGFDVGVAALRNFLDAGYVVVATDYQGLGTPGVHQYLVQGTESRNVLDSVLAARRMRTIGAGKRVAVLGWSQGGGVSVFLGQDATYGRGLHVVGVAALAPAANTGPAFARQVPPGPVSVASPAHQTALAVNVVRGLSAAYRELDPADVLTAPGLQALRGLDFMCINHLGGVIQEMVSDPTSLFVPTLPSSWLERLQQNTAGYAPTVAPVLVMQGTDDTVVNPNGTTQYIQRACSFGRPVQYSTYPGATHQTIPLAARDEYVRWIAARFAGRPPPSTC